MHQFSFEVQKVIWGQSDNIVQGCLPPHEPQVKIIIWPIFHSTTNWLFFHEVGSLSKAEQKLFHLSLTFGNKQSKMTNVDFPKHQMSDQNSKTTFLGCSPTKPDHIWCI